MTPLLLAVLCLQDPPIRVPEGWAVEKAAGPPLVERPIMAGFDDRGRLYVADSSGVNLRFDKLMEAPPHRIVRLDDADGDGRFDRSVVFAERITFPMGSLWHAGALYVCAPPSVWRFRDADDDGVADERVELGVGELGREVVRDDLGLRLLARREVLATGSAVRFGGLATALALAPQHRQLIALARLLEIGRAHV